MTDIRALAKAATGDWFVGWTNDESTPRTNYIAFMSPERALAMQDVIDAAKDALTPPYAKGKLAALHAALARLQEIR